MSSIFSKSSDLSDKSASCDCFLKVAKAAVMTSLIPMAVGGTWAWAEESAPPAESVTRAPNTEQRNDNFFPHVSYEARSLGAWRFAIRQTPGTNLNTTVWLSSFAIGLGHRFEIGTAPLLWTSANHEYNYSVKIEFWRGQEFTWAYFNSATRFKLKLSSDDAAAGSKPRIHLESSTLATTFRPSGQTWMSSVFGTVSQTYIDGVNNLTRLDSLRMQFEHGMDLQVPFGTGGDRLTFGIARLRETGISAYEDLETRLGLTYSWDFGPTAWMRHPQLGASLNPGTQNVRWLFNAHF